MEQTIYARYCVDMSQQCSARTPRGRAQSPRARKVQIEGREERGRAAGMAGYDGFAKTERRNVAEMAACSGFANCEADFDRSMAANDGFAKAYGGLRRLCESMWRRSTGFARKTRKGLLQTRRFAAIREAFSRAPFAKAAQAAISEAVLRNGSRGLYSIPGQDCWRRAS